MSIYNEYDKLQTIFLGQMIPSKIWKHLKIKTNKIVNKIGDETNEDLDKIQKFLESKGVKVYRPNMDAAIEIYNKYGSISNPGAVRDWLWSYGDKLLVCNLSWIDRSNEHEFWQDSFDDLRKKGKTISYMPKDDIKKDWDELSEKIPTYLEPNYNFKNDYPPKDNAHLTDIPILQDWQENCIDSLFYQKSLQKHFAIYSILHKYHFFHAASCFKHNDYIFSTPMGTIKGFTWFKKECEEVNPNVKFIIKNDSSHIDGGTIITSRDECVSIYKNFLPLDVLYLNIKSNTSDKNSDQNDERYKQILRKWGRKKAHIALKLYYENLAGYDQRVDFDINGISYKPNKLIATIFNDAVKTFLEEHNLTVQNIPLRHREVIQGGIHCYTCDIDRVAD